ncbi:MAG: enoyl-CoA hydratase-related protein [Candidatus Nanopelagicales bacterium]
MDTVTYEVAEQTATITLARPSKRNAFDGAMLHAMRDYGDAASADPNVRVVALTAAGTTFCAGADLSGNDGNVAGEAARALADLLASWSELPKPLVARVQGPVMGGGNGLLAACDVVVASTAATFAFREVRVGVVPAVIAVALQERLAPGSARELMLTGRTFDAAYAHQIGLVHLVVGPDTLDASVREVVAELAAGAPLAQAATKRLLLELATSTRAEQYARAAEISAAHFDSDEAREGMAAFREKRRPDW